MDWGYLRSWVIYTLLYPLKRRRMQRLFGPLLSEWGLVFDLGAHLGDKTRFFAEQDIRVVALEPQPKFQQKLQERFGNNGLVEILQSAVADQPGTMKMKISSGHPTVSTLNSELIDRVKRVPDWKGVSWDRVEEVDVTTLDLLIERFGTPDFCKIDVEGFEHRVLSGLSTPLPFLSFEFLPAYREPARKCVERLDELGKYTYNFTPQETFNMGQWMSSTEARTFIKAYEGSTSGDIYALQRG